MNPRLLIFAQWAGLGIVVAVAIDAFTLKTVEDPVTIGALGLALFGVRFVKE